MFKNYLKVAWRGLVRNKVVSFINVFGLAAGMAVVMLIGLWIFDEVSFNQYHTHYDRIARVMRNATYEGELNTDGSNSIPLVNKLKLNYGSDLAYVVPALGNAQHFIMYGDREFVETGNYMGPEAPELLSLRMIKGAKRGLQGIHSIMLSETVADKIFGQEDPINKILRVDNKQDVTVTGVYQDLPENSEFKDLDFISPFESWLSTKKDSNTLINDWNSEFISIYVQLNPQVDAQKVSNKIKYLTRAQVTGDKADQKATLFLHPMRDWHLYSKFENGVNVTSEELRFVWFYGTIGFFVLLLACINFMNLSTARSEKRAREVGVRKSIGSVRSQLISHFFIESLLVAGMAFLISILLVLLVLPWFNTVAGKSLTILWANPLFWLMGLAFVFITGVLAGCYPALYLSSFKAVTVLKGTFKAGKLAGSTRKVLVVLQFTVSIALIIGTIIVYRQIQHARDRPVGYTQNGLLSIQLTSPSLRQKYDVLMQELKNTGVVQDVALSQSPLTDIWNNTNGFSWHGSDNDTATFFGTISVTPDYGKTVGWQFVAGRDFSRDFGNDQAGLIVNETAVKAMRLKEPVGTLVSTGDTSRSYKIIGVVKDMIMRSPFKAAVPTIFYPGGGSWASIRITPHASAAVAIPKIRGVLKTLFPSSLLNIKFADENYAAKFRAEERVGNLAGFFTILAIIISCLGLFGLVAFVAEQRTREIAIRKVLGASVASLWLMLSKEFLLLVFIACAIAIPIAWLFMDEWLSQYEYRTTLSWWIFGLAVLGSMLITLSTISYQSIKAAMMNPVKSLRTE